MYPDGKKRPKESVVGMRSAFPTTPLGVGLVYAPGLEPLIRGERGLVDVLEIEPQTFWRKPAAGRYVVDTIRLNRLAELPGARIVHGVGFPVASVRPPDPAHLRPLVECITLTGAEWASEHLNFNRGEDADGIYDAGFLLPPCRPPLRHDKLQSGADIPRGLDPFSEFPRGSPFTRFSFAKRFRRGFLFMLTSLRPDSI